MQEAAAKLDRPDESRMKPAGSQNDLTEFAAPEDSASQFAQAPSSMLPQRRDAPKSPFTAKGMAKVSSHGALEAMNEDTDLGPQASDPSHLRSFRWSALCSMSALYFSLHDIAPLYG